jgi:PAS domain S-box-containing protein
MPRVDSTWYREVEQAIEFVTLMDADDRLLYVNHPQPGSESYAGRSVFDYVDPTYHDVLRRSVERARETGLPQHYESNACGPNGETATYRNWVFALRADEGVVAFIATDVTHQGRVEAALELSETTLRSLIENSPDTILVVDRQRKILFINRDEVGFGSDRILGTPAELFVPESERLKVVNAIEHVLEKGVPTHYDTELEDPKGPVRRYTTRLAPIACDGEVDRVMLVATDITDHHEAEQERERLAAQLQHAQKMEALGQLTGGVAHDFNNLLTAISNNCELAKIAEGDAEQSRFYIDQALESVRRASALTQRLLAFSRKQSLRPKNIDANSLVDGMQELLQRTLGETIKVRTSTPDGLWPCHVDPGQLENAILNLAVNARDAMPRGGEVVISNANVTLEHELDTDVPPGEFVRIIVSDNGTGMPPEVVTQAFEPFFTTKEVGHGSGLGLSMVYGFVRQSGGHLRVLTNLGAGTTIEIYLPRIHVEAEPHARPNPVDNIARGNDELILLVEDDPAVRSSVVILLQAIGYRTEAVENADTALKLLVKKPEIAIVLSDVVLPGGINGFELAEIARSKNPDLPVLLMSGYPERVLKQNSESKRIRVLEKPHTLEQLARALQDSLNGSRRRRLSSRPLTNLPLVKSTAAAKQSR